ncbi:putative autophagy-related protein 11 [Zophobas morio]|uniref:putative autophagy-related protein 11 n=1 Tax=Zophobas morio TaxID=2755281 RepID=UPI0030831E2E
MKIEVTKEKSLREAIEIFMEKSMNVKVYADNHKTDWSDYGYDLNKKGEQSKENGSKKKSSIKGMGKVQKIDNKREKVVKLATWNIRGLNEEGAMCCLRLKGRFQKIILINVRAPTEKTDIEVKEEFYETLDKEYGKIKKYDLKIVLGDLNAKIGQEELFRPTIGKCSKYEVTNNNGQILIEFAREKDMIIKNTYFQKKEIHKGTWIAPDRKTVNQIDHVLIERMEERSITDVRSYRGPDLDTDHFLVGVKMKQIVPVAKNRKNQERKNLKTCIRLKNEEERKMYLEMVNDWVAGERQDTEDIEDLWLEVKNGIRKASSQSTQETGKENKNERWFDKECEEELEKRTTLRLKVLKNETEENLIAYKEQRKICKRLLREKKRKYKERQLDEIEENYKIKEIRSMYHGLKQEKKGYQSSSVFYKNEKGELVGNEEKILELWQRYFDELLNGEENGGMIE